MVETRTRVAVSDLEPGMLMPSGAIVISVLKNNNRTYVKYLTVNGIFAWSYDTRSAIVNTVSVIQDKRKTPVF
jgi:hypothetical protein